MRAAVLDRHRTNLCTNPRAATNTNNWANNSLTTFERVTSFPATTGLPTDLPTGFHCIGDAAGDYATMDLSVTSGLRYIASTYLYIVSLSATNVNLRWVNTGTTTVDQVTHTGTGAWIRLSILVTANQTGTWKVRVLQAGAGASEYYFTGVVIEQASGLTPYFEGTPAVRINSF